MTPNKRPTLGHLFFVARAQLGMTQMAIASELGMSQSRFSKIEADRLEPGAEDMVWLINKILGTDVLAELDIALVPGRLKLEQAALKREHDDKKHAKKPHEKCHACIELEEAAKREGKWAKDRQDEMASGLPPRRLA